MAPKRPPNAADPANDPAWRDEIADVHPLGTRRTRPKPAAAQPPAETYVAPRWAPRHMPLVLHANTAACLAGLADGLPPSLLKDLALGKHRPTASLDLHGLQEGDAWLRLMNWLHQAADHDHRCVLVITGKGRGYGPAGDMGIIKAQAGQWLAGHPHVQAFHTAQPRDGGSGAVYVYLKRRR